MSKEESISLVDLEEKIAKKRIRRQLIDEGLCPKCGAELFEQAIGSRSTRQKESFWFWKKMLTVKYLSVKERYTCSVNEAHYERVTSEQHYSEYHTMYEYYETNEIKLIVDPRKGNPHTN